jgi:hypothetical protein
VFSCGCAIPILSRRTVIDPQPEPVCKIAQDPYAVPDAGPMKAAAK